jgi:aspartate/methionine/tyrosine aminotransferase
MRIEEFGVELWMNAHETHCAYNLAETCVRSLSVDEVLAFSGRREEVLAELTGLRLTYGAIEGTARLRSLIAGLYEHQSADNVVVTHGAIGANSLVHRALVDPGDRVVSVLPTYQQHQSIPESLGADVVTTTLREEHGWQLDLAELERLATPGTKLIALTNPNNPTGALLDTDTLQRVVGIARSAGAWILADEVYRGTDQEGGGSTPSIADLYEKGVAVGSMSKPFSLAGLRLGWIVAPEEVLLGVGIHRDYDTISVSQVDDLLASVALESKEQILERARTITRRNLGVLDAWVASRADVGYVRPASGTTALLRFASDVPSYAFCEGLLKDTGVLLTPGAAFGIEGTARIGYADDTDTLRSGLALLGQYLDRLGGSTAQD